jgi:anionic cell wall polymer biosynthesis LytR-Cps2A-Psr (LCP) family protein
MRRQRCLIGALIDQVNPVSMLGQYPQLAQVVKQNVSTDIQVSQLPAWVDLVQRIQKGSITSLTFTADNINPAKPDFTKMRDMVKAAISAPKPSETAPATAAPTTAPSTSSPAKNPNLGTSTTTTPTVAGGVVDVRESC